MNIPRLMGIINLTDDSFYPESRYISIDQLTDADIIDIGAESTRPYAKPVATSVQIKKLLPAIAEVRKNMPLVDISVDTSEPEVMQAAINAGAKIINDVRSLTTPGAIEIVAKHNITVCLTHMQGRPENMQDNPHYPNGVVNDILKWCHSNYERCIQAGIKPENIWIDPGFGFGKTIEHNWTILKNLEMITNEFKTVIGVSNKSMFKNIIGCEDVCNRNIPSRIAEAIATMKNVSIIRTHNPRDTKKAITVANFQGA